MAKETVIGSFIQRILFAVDDASIGQAKSAVSELKSFAANALGAIGIGFSVTQVFGLAEEFRTINEAIRGSTSELENQDAVQQKILEGAKACREEYGVMASNVTRLVEQNKDLFPLDDAVRYVSILEKIEKNAGRGANVDQVMDILKEVTAAGIMERGVFDRLREDAPELVNVLASSMGISIAQMQSLADAGTITASQIKEALFAAEEGVNAKFATLSYGIKDSLVQVRNEWGLWISDVDELLGLTDSLGRTIREVSTFLLDKLQKGTNLLKAAADQLGGVDQLLKLILITSAAIFVATKGTAILSFLSGALKFLQGINLQTAIAAAKWLLLFLVLEDVFSFLSGGDSIIGRLLSSAGVDVDELREKVSAFFSAAKALGKEALEAMAQFWRDHGDEVVAVLQNLWSIASNIVSLIVSLVSGTLGLLSGFLKGFETGDWTDFLSACKTLWSGFLDGINSLGQAVFGDLWDPLKDSAQAVWDWLKGLFDWFGEKIAWARDLWGGVKDFLGFDEPDDPNGYGSDPFGLSGGLPVSSSDVSQGVSRAAANRSVTVTQENNQQYTFHVTEREAADRLENAVDSQESQSSAELARALGYGR